MTDKERKFFSGNNLEHAILQAARYHGISPDEVDYKQLKKRHGFLRARRGVVIEVDPQAPRRTADAVDERAGAEPAAVPQRVDASTEPKPQEKPKPVDVEAREEAEDVQEPVAERRQARAEPEAGLPANWPLPPESRAGGATEPRRQRAGRSKAAAKDEGELVAAAEESVEQLLEFARLELEVEVAVGEGELEIELNGKDRDRLLEDRGSLLLAIQHLLPRMVRGRTGSSMPCRVDSEDFHEQRAEELRELAQDAAAEVRSRRRPRTLRPMNPAERRIVHLTLADDPEVITESEGRGFFKRVSIRPAARRPRGFDPYSR